MNRFLEEYGFVSPSEKVGGTVLLGLIAALGGISISLVFLLFFTFPVLLIFPFSVFCIYLIFKYSTPKCPLCHEWIETAHDREMLSDGTPIHEWCSNLVEKSQ